MTDSGCVSSFFNVDAADWRQSWIPQFQYRQRVRQVVHLEVVGKDKKSFQINTTIFKANQPVSNRQRTWGLLLRRPTVTILFILPNHTLPSDKNERYLLHETNVCIVTSLDRTGTMRKAWSRGWAISYTGRTIVLRFRITTCSKSGLYSIITRCRTFCPYTPCWPCSINYNAYMNTAFTSTALTKCILV